ncbi:hypothetical protein TIFTF001_021074 [Ficus carica]|uniref:Uncharacterized protein n=1 Tax=Ficus carica TaxID=3494 RepID=A0AA88DAE2_FICCA|nr:hypothetical protein TIFTF001_021074 [Ficus carica]
MPVGCEREGARGKERGRGRGRERGGGEERGVGGDGGTTPDWARAAAVATGRRPDGDGESERGVEDFPLCGTSNTITVMVGKGDQPFSDFGGDGVGGF